MTEIHPPDTTKPAIDTPCNTSSASFSVKIDITEDSRQSVDWLAGACDLSKTQLKECMTKGAVWLQRKGKKPASTRPLRRAKTPLYCGDQLFLYFNPDVLQQIPPTPELLSDQGTYSAWHKPSGMLSHGSKWGDHCSIIRWVEQYHQPQRPCYLVHRLDRATSGLMLIAHTKKTATQLSRQFEQRQTTKRYRAIIEGKLANNELTFDTAIDGKKAHTDVKTLDYDPSTQTSLIDVTLHTGRKHQIRKHLSQAGYPIVGDSLYNPRFADNHRLDKDSITRTPNLQLQAYLLGFTCPITNEYQEFTIKTSSLIDTKNSCAKNRQIIQQK